MGKHLQVGETAAAAVVLVHVLDPKYFPHEQAVELPERPAPHEALQAVLVHALVLEEVVRVRPDQRAELSRDYRVHRRVFRLQVLGA